jgi:KDO2-lipid IV(A) lauroyltransferase
MGYKALLLFEKILMLFPKKMRKAFFTSLAFIAYKVLKKYRRIVRQNLNYAFDNKLSEEEIEAITKYSFRNLALNFHHLMELRHMSQEDLAKMVTVQNKEAVEKVHAQGRAIIYVTTHYCSWELGGASLGALVEPLAAVYKKMKNREYEEWLLSARARFGNTNLEKTNVLKPLIRLIRQKKASGILIDTNLNAREGTIVEFMGKPIRQTTTPAYLARKFDAAIIPVTIRTDDEENYTLMLFDEIPVEKTDNEEADIHKATQLQADWLTSIITKEPKFWFWLHRRWKGDKPEIYKKD